MRFCDRLILIILYALLLITPILSWRFIENPLLISNLKETFILVSIVILVTVYLLDNFPSKRQVSIPLKYPIMGLVVTSAVSIFGSKSLIVSIREFYGLLLLVIFYSIVYVSMKGEKERVRLIASLIIVTSFISVYFLMQYFNIDPLGLRQTYPSATFTNQNFLAGFLSTVLPLSVAFIFITHQKGLKAIFSLLAVLLFISILFTRTRGAWVSVLLGLVFFFYLVRHDGLLRKRGIVLVLLLFAVFTTAIIGLDKNERFSFTERFRSIFNLKDSSNKHRLLMWRSSLDMIKDSPLIGIGIGTFDMNYPKYQGKYLRLEEYANYTGSTIHAHNEYIETAAETGLLGIGSLIWLIIAIFKYGMDIVNNKERGERLLIFGILSSIATILIYGLFSFPFHMPTTWMLFWFLIGILGSMTLQPSVKTKYSPVWVRIGIVIIALFLLSWTTRPFIANIYFYKGYWHGKNGRWEEGVNSFQRAIRINPDDYKSHYNLAVLYEDRDMLLSAIDEYGRVLRLYPTHVETHLRLGNLYESLGDHDNAQKEYKKAEEIFPNSF